MEKNVDWRTFVLGAGIQCAEAVSVVCDQPQPLFASDTSLIHWRSNRLPIVNRNYECCLMCFAYSVSYTFRTRFLAS
eukprot:1191106-Prorocentrum_minimum.AAC.2